MFNDKHKSFTTNPVVNQSLQHSNSLVTSSVNLLTYIQVDICSSSSWRSCSTLRSSLWPWMELSVTSSISSRLNSRWELIIYYTEFSLHALLSFWIPLCCEEIPVQQHSWYLRHPNNITCLFSHVIPSWCWINTFLSVCWK